MDGLQSMAREYNSREWKKFNANISYYVYYSGAVGVRYCSNKRTQTVISERSSLCSGELPLSMLVGW